MTCRKTRCRTPYGVQVIRIIRKETRGVSPCPLDKKKATREIWSLFLSGPFGLVEILQDRGRLGHLFLQGFGHPGTLPDIFGEEHGEEFVFICAGVVAEEVYGHVPLVGICGFDLVIEPIMVLYEVAHLMQKAVRGGQVDAVGVSVVVTGCAGDIIQRFGINPDRPVGILEIIQQLVRQDSRVHTDGLSGVRRKAATEVQIEAFHHGRAAGDGPIVEDLPDGIGHVATSGDVRRMSGLRQEAELDSGVPAGDEPGLVVLRITGQVSRSEDRTIHPVVCDGRAEIIQTSSEPAVVEAMVYGLECIVGVVFDTPDDEDEFFDGGLAVRLEFVVAGTDNDMVVLQLGDSFSISGVRRNVCEGRGCESRDAA